MMKKVLLLILKMIFGLFLFIYIGACCVLFFRQEALLFFPDPESSQEAKRYSQYDVKFEVNGEILDGWYIPGNSGSTLVYYGGNADEISLALDNLLRLGPYNYLMVNYRGYGESTGSPSEVGLKADAAAILEQAAEQFAFATTDTVIIGRSLGTGIATSIAAEYPIKGLVLVTPFDSVLNVAKGRYAIFPVGALLNHPFDSTAYVEKIDIPTLIIKAETDFVIPHRYTDNLIALWQSPLLEITLPGTHGNVVDSEEYVQSIQEFIRSL